MVSVYIVNYRKMANGVFSVFGAFRSLYRSISFAMLALRATDAWSGGYRTVPYCASLRMTPFSISNNSRNVPDFAGRERGERAHSVIVRRAHATCCVPWLQGDASP